MLLNNLLRPNLPPVLLLLQSVLYFFDGGERVSVELSLLHTKDPYSEVQTCKSHMLVPFCDFSFTLTSLPVVNFIFEHYQQSRASESHTKLLCHYVGCTHHHDSGSYAFWKLYSWLFPSLYHSKYVSVVVTEVWKLSELCFISKLAPTNNSNKKWAWDKIHAVVLKERGSSKKLITILWNITFPLN